MGQLRFTHVRRNAVTQRVRATTACQLCFNNRVSSDHICRRLRHEFRFLPFIRFLHVISEGIKRNKFTTTVLFWRLALSHGETAAAAKLTAPVVFGSLGFEWLGDVAALLAAKLAMREQRSLQTP
jgi:hypothetical protein